MCGKLRWNRAGDRKRGTPAIIRWHDRRFTGKVIDVFGRAEKQTTGARIRVALTPVLHLSRRSYGMASMDKVRSALVRNARGDTRSADYFCSVVPHGEPRRLHLQPISRELAPSPCPKSMASFLQFSYMWPRTPRKCPATKTPKKKRRSSWRADAPQDNKTLCRMIDLSWRRKPIRPAPPPRVSTSQCSRSSMI